MNTLSSSQNTLNTRETQGLREKLTSTFHQLKYASALVLAMTQMTPDAAGQGITSHRLDAKVGSAYTDKVLDNEFTPNTYTLGYTRDNQGWDSKTGFQMGLETTYASSEESINNKYSTLLAGVHLGSYITLPTNDSYGDYFEHGGSTTLNLNVGTGRIHTEATIPTDGNIEQSGMYAKATFGINRRRRGEDAGFEIGPYITAYMDNLDGRRRGNDPDLEFGIKASYIFSIND